MAHQGLQPHSVGGAGVTAASNVSKDAPTPSQGSAKNVIEAGLNYYPILKAKKRAYTIYRIPIISDNWTEQNIHLLSGLWDAAGSACSLGALKGRSWFNEIADRHHP